jgi:2-polyprenyl-3-methyl-5-hydroxy-6-metoxy-1,4-benzoquinol methylase
MVRWFRRWTLRPVYVLYYRLLFRARFPGSDNLAQVVSALESRGAHGDTPEPKDLWEEKYRSGRWEFMRDLYEVPRYASIAALAHTLRPDAAILDIGCGEGLLQSHLAQVGYRRYLGIDLAETAIEQAAGRADERTSFVAADAETFVPDGTFDVVIFNECVHYFHSPGDSVAAYERSLTADGLFIVSAFRTPRGDAIMRELIESYAMIEKTSIGNRKGTSLVVVLAPDHDAH